MKNRNIYFCSFPHKNSKTETNTGGKRRVIELYNSISEKQYPTKYISSLFEAFRIGFKVKEADIAIGFDERYLPIGILLSLFGCSLVFCPRGNKLEHHKYSYGPVKLKIYKYIFSFLYRFCDKMIFQTYAQHKEFEITFGCKCKFEVVPNNVSASWMRNLGSNKSFSNTPTLGRIGFLGGDNPRKGGELLIKAYQEAKAEGLKASLLVAGNYEDPPSIYGVEFIGYINNLKEFYESVDLIVVPSEYDSFPNTILEGLAAKKPVIVADSPIMQEIFYGAEGLIFKRKASRLANKIKDLYMSEYEWERVIKSSIVLHQRYSFNWCKEMEKNIIGGY